MNSTHLLTRALVTLPQNFARGGDSKHDKLLGQFASLRLPFKLVPSVEVLGARHDHIHVCGFGGTAGHDFKVVVHTALIGRRRTRRARGALVTVQVHYCLFIDIEVVLKVPQQLPIAHEAADAHISLLGLKGGIYPLDTKINA